MAEPGLKSDLLDAVNDRFSGRTIKTRNLDFQSDEDFENRLKASLDHWKETGVGGVWVQIAKEHCSLMAVCVRNGFEIHHARPGYVMMNKWLPESQSTLPEYANHYIGAAGFVINNRGQVLLVNEKFGDRVDWKLPGGHADLGEEIGDAAVRETFEETGVHCKFVSLLTFRHMHQYRHGLSDIYFICLLEPVTEEINKCDREIADCEWRDLEEWSNDDKTSAVNKYACQVYKEYKEHGFSILNQGVLNYYKNKHNLMYKPSQGNHNGPNKL